VEYYEYSGVDGIEVVVNSGMNVVGNDVLETYSVSVRSEMFL
jgi:hypothetical protein